VKNRKGWISLIIALTLVFSLVVYAFAAESDGRFVKVTAYDVNIRSGPGTENKVIDHADYGDSYEVVTTSDGWYQVRLDGDRTGWISAALVKEGGRWQSSNPNLVVAEATAEHVNVRGGASTSYDVITTISPGVSYPLLATSGDWVQLRLPDERTGWVSRQFVQVTESKAKTTAKEEQQQAAVTADMLNVRRGKSTDSEVLGQLRLNELVKVLATEGEWSQIEYKGSIGYVSTSYLRLPGKPAPVAEPVPTNETVPSVTLKEAANLRSGPGTNFTLLQTGSAGASFPLVGKSGNWYEIRLQNGKHAWVAGWLTDVQGQAAAVPDLGDSPDSALRGRTIVLDAGHGGLDVGAVGRDTGVEEKDVNLALTRILYNKLLATGAHVVMTRPDDRTVSLADRVAVSTKETADAFVSLHHNTNEDRNLSGTMTFYYREQGADHNLAALVQKELVQRLGLPDLGARFGDYYVLRENPQTAVLVETSFLTNPADERTAQDPAAQERAAEGIFQALIQYFSQQKTS
jgi:N-acetylmuramoyl-L-alanine amidase